MDGEVQRVYDRIRLHQLVKAHPRWTDAAYAIELNRSTSWVQKWRERLAKCDPTDIQSFMSDSRAPQTRQEIDEPVKKAITDLREELSEVYHRPASAKLIQLKLNEIEPLQEAGYFVPQSPTTINKVLRERGYIQPRPKRWREPLELPAPNEEWEMDFGEIRIDHETILEFFLVVDRGTSRVIYLEGSMGYNAEMALEAVARCFKQCGMPNRLRFDRDVRFVGSWTGRSYPSALIRFLRVMGITPVVCPPRRPDLKPIVERTILTLKSEWLDRHSINSYADGVEALATFEGYYNQERIHFGRACNGRIPNDAFPDWPTLPTLPDSVNPNAWLESYHQRVYQRRITTNGTFQIDKYTYYIDRQYAKRSVLVHVDASSGQFRVVADEGVIAVVDMKGLASVDQLPFDDYLRRMKQEARSIEMHRFMTWFTVSDAA